MGDSPNLPFPDLHIGDLSSKTVKMFIAEHTGDVEEGFADNCAETDQSISGLVGIEEDEEVGEQILQLSGIPVMELFENRINHLTVNCSFSFAVFVSRISWANELV